MGTTVDSTNIDFGTLFQALRGVAPAGDWTMVDLSYQGDIVDPNGNPEPLPYAPCDTTSDIWGSRDTMAQSLVRFQAVHPTDRIVLVGHSLGGFLAYYMAQAPAKPHIAANVSIDAPLHGASGWDWLAALGCSGGPAFNELYEMGRPGSDAVTTAMLNGAYHAGATARNVGIVANEADCVYDLALPNCALPGTDWRGTMFAPADWTGTYNDVVEGVGSLRAEIATPHGAILHDYSAMLDVARFLAR